MKLFLIEQDVNNDYDTYDSAVVVAETSEEARLIHPGDFCCWQDGEWTAQTIMGNIMKEYSRGSWAHPDDVKVTYLGIIAENSGVNLGDVICASFKAG